MADQVEFRVMKYRGRPGQIALERPAERCLELAWGVTIKKRARRFNGVPASSGTWFSAYTTTPDNSPSRRQFPYVDVVVVDVVVVVVGAAVVVVVDVVVVDVVVVDVVVVVVGAAAHLRVSNTRQPATGVNMPVT